MKKMKKFVVPINAIVFGEDIKDAISYAEDALDSSVFVQQDGIIAVEVVEDDVELYDEDEEHESLDDDEEYEEL